MLFSLVDFVNLALITEPHFGQFNNAKLMTGIAKMDSLIQRIPKYGHTYVL